MTGRADFCVYLLGGAVGLEGIAAAAANHYLVIFRMYIFFHSDYSKNFKKTILAVFLLFATEKTASLAFFSLLYSLLKAADLNIITEVSIDAFVFLEVVEK